MTPRQALLHPDTQRELAAGNELRHAAEALLRLTDAEPPLPLPVNVWAALAKLKAAVAKMPRDEWEA